jgi:hypothetical protein
LQSDEFGFLSVRSEDFVSKKPEFIQASGSLIQHARPDKSLFEICCISLVHWQQEQASTGWSKNIQNYGKWKGAINKFGGLQSESDRNSLYGGIMQRAKSSLQHFGYLSPIDNNNNNDDTSVFKTSVKSSSVWKYDFDSESCSAFSVESCPNRAHIQKCL